MCHVKRTENIKRGRVLAHFKKKNVHNTIAWVVYSNLRVHTSKLVIDRNRFWKNGLLLQQKLGLPDSLLILHLKPMSIKKLCSVAMLKWNKKDWMAVVRCAVTSFNDIKCLILAQHSCTVHDICSWFVQQYETHGSPSCLLLKTEGSAGPLIV